MSDDSEPPILNYATAPRWVVIARLNDEFTAHLAASKLEAEGIETNLSGRSYVLQSSYPTAVAVRAEDAAAAREVLKHSPAARWLVE
jgi:hypothetical protein